MKKIDDNIYHIRIGYFNMYVVKGIDGDILIDTGFILMKHHLKRILDKFNIKLIILTHAHVDHVWNTSYISKLYNAKIALGKDDLINLDNSKIHTVASKKSYRLWTKLMTFGMSHFKEESFNPDILFDYDKIYNMYGIKFKIVNLKGHTNGSIGVLYKDYLFAGDALVNRKSYVEIAYQNQNNEQAKKSFRKIVNMKPKIVFIGHDKPIKYEKLIKSYKIKDSAL